MSLGVYKVPDPLKDEDKWFKFFTKKQLLYIVSSIAVGALLFVFFKKIGLEIIGIVLGLMVIIVVALFAMISMPPERYLSGGGYSLEQLTMRLLHKRLKGHHIYVKNYWAGKQKTGRE